MIDDLLDSVELAARMNEFVGRTGRKPLLLGVDEMTWYKLKARVGKARPAFQGVPLAPMAGHCRDKREPA